MRAGVRANVQPGRCQFANFFPRKKGFAIFRQVSISPFSNYENGSRDFPAHQVRGYHRREIAEPIIESEHHGVVGQRSVLASRPVKLAQREHVMMFLQVIEML
jgi:hypothetical protein